MPSVVLRDIAIPDFGVPLAPPAIAPATYDRRCREAYARAGRDWLVVYGDREHAANIAFLSGLRSALRGGPSSAWTARSARARRRQRGPRLCAALPSSGPRDGAGADHEPHGPGPLDEAQPRRRFSATPGSGRATRSASSAGNMPKPPKTSTASSCRTHSSRSCNVSRAMARSATRRRC